MIVKDFISRVERNRVVIPERKIVVIRLIAIMEFVEMQGEHAHKVQQTSWNSLQAMRDETPEDHA